MKKPPNKVRKTTNEPGKLLPRRSANKRRDYHTVNDRPRIGSSLLLKPKRKWMISNEQNLYTRRRKRSGTSRSQTRRLLSKRLPPIAERR